MFDDGIIYDLRVGRIGTADSNCFSPEVYVTIARANVSSRRYDYGVKVLTGMDGVLNVGIFFRDVVYGSQCRIGS